MVGQNIQFPTMLILDSDQEVRELKSNKNTYVYHSSRFEFYAIGVPVPIIIRGKKCVGLAIPKAITFDEAGSVLKFRFKEVSDSAAQEYLKLYVMISASNPMNDSGDPYEDAESQMIPGAIGIGMDMDDFEPDYPSIHKPRISGTDFRSIVERFGK